MTQSLAFVLLYCAVFLVLIGSGQNYKDRYRLQLHYSVPSGWLNDPNGLAYHNGAYHLFYQHYPDKPKWGPMHWGHATSPDLMHWKNQPIALKPYGKGDIFSGCCVVDSKNVTGLAQTSNSLVTHPLVALYTLDSNGNQSQAMAYSFDNGLTWTQYKANPIIPNAAMKDFRDPNVIERNGTFYMTLAAGDQIMFYSSKDMKSWKRLQEFGIRPSQGDKSGVWECPSVVELKDEKGEEYDILIVSENGDSHGSLTQYFIGKFDGTKFINKYGESGVLWVDHGPDNYAAVPYHNDPRGRVVLIGWMSNWLYGQMTPATTWRGQMTIPRKLSLRTVDGRVHLVQRPVEELSNIKDLSRTWMLPQLVVSGEQLVDLTPRIPFKTGSMLSLDYRMNVNAANKGKVGLRFSNSLGEFVSFYYHIQERIYELDRQNSGQVLFSSRFANAPIRANRICTSNVLTGQIILDTGSIEIFADGGLNTFTALFFPTMPFENLQIHSAIEEAELGKAVDFQYLNVTALRSIWN